MKERNFKLDLIRFMGVLTIMVAHSSPPAWLFQLRNFGTPLLILGSSLTYSYIYRDKLLDPIPFLKKRLKRLTIPLWLFLSFFFLFFGVVGLLLNKSFSFFSVNTIIKSYLMYGGIGMVRIFKVYIILALITPLCLKLSKSSINNRKYFSLIIAIYILYEFINYFFFNNISSAQIKSFVTQHLIIVVPYAALYLYGLRLHLFSYRSLRLIIISSLLLFVILVIQKFITYGEFVQTQNYKYPPTLYYLSYAFLCVNLCYYIVQKYVKITTKYFKNLIIWLSSNSLWIYLWHIFAFFLWESLVDNYFQNNFLIFCVKTTFLLSFGILMTYIQLFIVNKLLSRRRNSKNLILLYLK